MDPITEVHAEEHGSEAKKVNGNLIKALLFAFAGLVILVLAFIYIPKWAHNFSGNDTAVSQTKTVNLSKLTKETGLGDVEIPESGERRVTMDVVNGHYQEFAPTCPEKITFIDPFGNECFFKDNHFLGKKPNPNSGWYIIKGKPGTQVTFQSI